MVSFAHASLARGDSLSIGGLMELWESNYRRMQQLIPDLETLDGSARSITHAGPALLLEFEERTPYTTSLMLTYRLADGDELPKLRVKVYRDVGLAQALDAERSEFGEHIQKQYERSTLLNKWLEYCLDRGHGFVKPR